MVSCRTLHVVSHLPMNIRVGDPHQSAWTPVTHGSNFALIVCFPSGSRKRDRVGGPACGTWMRVRQFCDGRQAIDLERTPLHIYDSV